MFSNWLNTTLGWTTYEAGTEEKGNAYIDKVETTFQTRRCRKNDNTKIGPEGN